MARVFEGVGAFDAGRHAICSASVGGPLIVAEYVAYDSRLPFGSLNPTHGRIINLARSAAGRLMR